MATDGVADNLDKGAIAEVILTNKIQGPKAQQVVQVAELVGLGLSGTPFSRKAMQAGLLIQGGRQDDASVLIMTVGSAQDLFARRAAMRAQSEAQLRALEQQGAPQPRQALSLAEALVAAQQGQ